MKWCHKASKVGNIEMHTKLFDPGWGRTLKDFRFSYQPRIPPESGSMNFWMPTAYSTLNLYPTLWMLSILTDGSAFSNFRSREMKTSRLRLEKYWSLSQILRRISSRLMIWPVWSVISFNNSLSRYVSEWFLVPQDNCWFAGSKVKLPKVIGAGCESFFETILLLFRNTSCLFLARLKC